MLAKQVPLFNHPLIPLCGNAIPLSHPWRMRQRPYGLFWYGSVMEFTKSDFAGFFLLVFCLYWGIKQQRLRLIWLLAASCFFYISTPRQSWKFIFLILGSTSIDYLVALVLETVSSAKLRKLLVGLSVIYNLAILSYFKYFLFAQASAATMGGWFGFSWPGPSAEAMKNLILPLGISFYTFEAISYIVDVYRQKIRAVRNPLHYALYIFFFPHLVAGPIVRSGDFFPQVFHPRRFSWLRVQYGMQLFIFGLFKKAVIADHLAAVTDPVFNHPGHYGSSALWLAMLGFSVRIYCDFSGYSDMAIGLAHTLGFKLPANFRMPYFATSPSDFWQRWHISLSRWLRDYLYIPLGGNRGGTWLTYRNLMLTMLLGGFWHGANWTFLVWGGYHGFLLVLQRVCPWPRFFQGRWFRPVSIALTFLAVSVGWVVFRANSLPDAATILGGLVRPVTGQSLAVGETYLVLVCLMATFLAHLLGTFANVRKLEQRLPEPVAGAALAIAWVVYFLLLPSTGGEFIYFHF